MYREGSIDTCLMHLCGRYDIGQLIEGHVYRGTVRSDSSKSWFWRANLRKLSMSEHSIWWEIFFSNSDDRLKLLNPMFCP